MALLRDRENLPVIHVPSKSSLALAAAVTALAILVAGCAGPAPGPQSRTFDLKEYDFDFSLKTIEVNQNDNVTILLTNNGTMPHDLTVVGAYNINRTVAVNATETINFVATVKGSFEFYCSIPGHKQLGMVGTLNVN